MVSPRKEARMKRLLHTSLLSMFLIAQCLHARSALYKWITAPLKVDINLKNLNILTFTPTVHPHGVMRSIDTVCTAIQRGQGNKNDTTHTVLDTKILNLSCAIPSGYKNKTIFIYVSGYAGPFSTARYKYAGSGAYSAYMCFEQGIMHDAPCISFDAPVNYPSSFNLGQKLDQDCLDAVYQETVRLNPEAHIVLVGLCRGATTILNYLTNPSNKRNFEPIKAVILESPILSLEALINQVTQTQVPKDLGLVLPYLLQATLPNYEWNQPTIIQHASAFPDHIPILMSGLVHDTIASYQDICAIIQSLKDAQKNIDFFACDAPEIKHANLVIVKDYQEKVHTFLRNHGLTP